MTAIALAVFASAAAVAQAPPPKSTDLDAFMARALQQRDVDRKTLGDYVLDEVETFEILGPGGAPINRFKREYTWYARDGIHVRSPLKYDAKQGKAPDFTFRPVDEPRFVSESYFMDFKFERGNYYLAGREKLDGHDVLRIDYLPTHLFDDDNDEGRAEREAERSKERTASASKEDNGHASKREQKDERTEQDIERKLNKTAQVTLWVDPGNYQIVKYTFANIWMDFLPGGWLVKVDDLHASMEMGQPFQGVWLPRNISIHGGFTLANGSYEASYRRDFSRYRKADVSSRVTIPKEAR
jgi:hypothetical protein